LLRAEAHCLASIVDVFKWDVRGASPVIFLSARPSVSFSPARFPAHDHHGTGSVQGTEQPKCGPLVHGRSLVTTHNCADRLPVRCRPLARSWRSSGTSSKLPRRVRDRQPVLSLQQNAHPARRFSELLVGVVTGVILMVATAPPVAAATGDSVSGPPSLVKAVSAIEDQSRYEPANWGIQVLNEDGGDVLASQNSRKLFLPGSTMKLYSVATALKLYGPGYRFKTPVYRQGTVTAGTLNGNLVLVASGDTSMGLRELPNGTLYYENAPEVNQNTSNIGVPGAIEPPGNPLAALDQLAGMVRASGITNVNGNVIIDDRLFTPYDGFQNGLISPIWVNENLIDVLVTPTTVGQPASFSQRPMTASYSVTSQVTTVAADKTTSVEVSEPSPGNLVVTGQIAAGSRPTLVTKQVDDPAAFARTLFIEALQNAGVTVAAPTLGPNPESLLPATGSYQAADMLGEHVSAPLSEFANLILKVSYNRGADDMTCLAAVKIGSTDCSEGLVAEMDAIKDSGVSDTSVFPFDGAGSDTRNRTSPAAMATFLRRVAKTSYGPALIAALPVLGRSGALATLLPHSPMVGHAQVKDGNIVAGTPASQIIVLGNSLAGYVHTKSGRHVTFMIVVGNVPVTKPADVLQVTEDQARIVEAVYKDL
jgi:serine-type D-Ala-D-Ala carboxypeptidase/endopeptidase (penicillin-binding protein 4)